MPAGESLFDQVAQNVDGPVELISIWLARAGDEA
jgi:hypothetical protein